MPYEPFERVALGRTGLSVTRLGLGGGSIGGLYRPVAEEDAMALVEHAWELGLRSFDVAPLYGYGAAERRMGAVLASKPRDAFVLSTKVGRLVVRSGDLTGDEDLDRQASGGREDAYFADTAGRRMVFDYSAEGVRRSLEGSLERLGLDRIDIAYVHDPDNHWPDVIAGAYPALHRLREEGVLGAIGAGMNQSAMLTRFVRETDVDVLLLAGRYTLLDQEALDELLPACLQRGVAVLAAGVMNSGVLANPRPGATFDYTAAPEPVVERACALRDACERHGVPVKAAAMQVPLAHPAVAGLIAGVRTMAHLEEYRDLLRLPIPRGLWDELRSTGLLPASMPVPGEAAA